MQLAPPAPVMAEPSCLRGDVGRVDVGHEPPSQDHLDASPTGRSARPGRPRSAARPARAARAAADVVPDRRPGRRRRRRGSGARRSAPSARRSSPGRRSASAGCRRTATTPATSMPGVRTSYSRDDPLGVLAGAARGRSTGRLRWAPRSGGRGSGSPTAARPAAGRAGAGPRGCSRCRPRGGAGWASSVMSSPSRVDGARGRRAHAHDRLDQLGLAVALDAGDAEHLALVDGEARCRRAAARAVGRPDGAGRCDRAAPARR